MFSPGPPVLTFSLAKMTSEAQNLLAKTEFLLVCGQLATVSLEPWNLTLLSRSSHLGEPGQPGPTRAEPFTWQKIARLEGCPGKAVYPV